MARTARRPAKPPASPSVTDPYWTVEELLHRVGKHDFTVQEWVVLSAAWRLAEDGRVRVIGRPCGTSGRPGIQWTAIPAHAVIDLVIPSRPRAQPHPGDVFWRSTGERAYAFVQFCEADLMCEWLGEVFARPRHEMPGDVVIPPAVRAVEQPEALAGVAGDGDCAKPPSPDGTSDTVAAAKAAAAAADIALFKGSPEHLSKAGRCRWWLDRLPRSDIIASSARALARRYYAAGGTGASFEYLSRDVIGPYKADLLLEASENTPKNTPKNASK